MDICTIIAKNYAAQARVLARSFAEHHPEGRCFTLVLDECDDFLHRDHEPFEIVKIGQLGIEEFDRMACSYDVLELSTAVKPWLLRYLLKREDVDDITYLDPDIEVFSRLDEVAHLARKHGLVLTPHVTASMPRDGKRPSETDILVAGAFNLGFVSLGGGEAAHKLIDWWAERLREDCRVDPERGYFVDQRWMDFAPGLVPDLAILRDPGYNVAYWNLSSRRLTRDNGRVLVNGHPLRFFHYSGYDAQHPNRLSRHQNRILFENDPLLRELCDSYRRQLLESGQEEASSWKYSYRQLADGTSLTRLMRRQLGEAFEEGAVARPLSDPVEAARFIEWLNEPAVFGGEEGVTRHLLEIWRLHPELQSAYPDLDDGDASGYIGWINKWMADDVPAALRPNPKPLPDARADLQSSPDDDAPSGVARTRGVNVIGYLSSELGVGEAGRQAITALDAANIAVSPVRQLTSLNRQGHAFATSNKDALPFAVNLVCVNADALPELMRRTGGHWRDGRYTIGMWFWEVSTFPERWQNAFDHLDEIWVATDHIADAVSPHSPVPVTKITLPIQPVTGALLSRKRLRLPDGFVFLFSYDYNSVFERKNPLGLVEAYIRAFPRAGACSLVLKSINHESDEANHVRLLDAVKDRPDIHVVDRYVSLQEKNSMMAACDCYISLHRAEGLGLTMGEAMAFGKPVIATGYSGNLDFMTSTNSHLVRHRLVPIGADVEPYPSDGEWAEPDLDHAAELMRRVVRDPEAARALGERAQAEIGLSHSAVTAGKSMSRRLAQIFPRVPRPACAGPYETRMLLDATTDVARHRIRAGPRGAARGPRASLRKLVLRTLRPYTEFQREIDEQMLTTLDAHVTATARALDELHDLGGIHEATALSALRRQESVLRSDQYVADRDLHGRLDQALCRLDSTERRLRRLEQERIRADRWPVESPWTHEYNAAHRSFVAMTVDDSMTMRLFEGGRPLPPGFGVGLDERVVEYPWLFAQDIRGKALDAGSTLNHAHILERLQPRVDGLTIATLVSEEPALTLPGVVYDDADIRKLPYADAAFDTVLCISTLEHIGMDNSSYGVDAPRSENPRSDLLEAVDELRRVTKPGGSMFLTVPYGIAEDLGWQRQIDRAELEAIIEACLPAEISLTVYRYGEYGWQLSDLAEAADARYRDHGRDPSPVPDHAAAARAVACLRVVGQS